MSTNMSKRQTTTIHDKRYQSLISFLVQLRKGANISQKKLAEIIGLSQSDISKIESCERRIDVIELVDYMRAIDPAGTECKINYLLERLLKE